MRLSTHRRVKAEDIDLHKGERESRIDKRMRKAKETEQHLEIFFLGLIAFIAVLRVYVVSFAHWLHTASTDSLTEGSCSLWHFCYTLLLFSGSSSFLLLFPTREQPHKDRIFFSSQFTTSQSSHPFHPLSRALAATFPEKINFQIA